MYIKYLSEINVPNQGSSNYIRTDELNQTIDNIFIRKSLTFNAAVQPMDSTPMDVCEYHHNLYKEN